LLGMSLNFLSKDKNCSPGVELAAGSVLKFGVSLLGVRILTSDMINMGWITVVVVIAGIFTTIVFGSILARFLGLDKELGLLSGGAVAICGISAAMAISSVMPKNKEMEQHTIVTVVMVAAFGSMAMIFYPIFVSYIGLDTVQAGLFLGGSIHDVSHVVGAGYSMSDEIGNSAMIIKMLRVALLLPVVGCFYLYYKRDHSQSQSTVKVPVPWFLIGFVLIVIINNLGLIPEFGVGLMNKISRWCLVIAIVGLGMKTSFQGLLANGWQPIVLVLGESLFLSALVMAWVLMS